MDIVKNHPILSVLAVGLVAYIAGTAWGAKTPVVSTVASNLPGAKVAA